MAQFLRIGGLDVHPVLKKCVESQIIPGTGVSADKFWASLETILKEFTPQNEALLKKRDAIQAQIDAWTLMRQGTNVVVNGYLLASARFTDLFIL